MTRKTVLAVLWIVRGLEFPSIRDDTPVIATTPAPSQSPLSPEHLRELADAKLRSRKIYRAASVAALSGWSMAAFAAVTLIGVVFGDLVSLIVGAGLSLISFNELRGGRMIRRFDVAGASVLGWNQIALGALIVAYALWSMAATLHSPALAQVGSTGNPDIDRTLSGLNSLVAYGVYGTIAVAGIIGPGLTAWYYFSRAPLVRGVVEQTQPWVLEAIKAAA